MTPKTKLTLLGATLGLLAVSQPAHAVVLFTDNFTVTTAGNDPNAELSNGRQGGTLVTPISYTDRYGIGDSREQLGNPDSFPGSAGALLIAYGGGVFLNYNFATVSQPISITFDAIIGNAISTDASNWVSLTVLNSTTQTNFVTAADFGMLFRANGGTQLFDRGTATTGVSATGTSFNTYTTYTVVLSDLAGTGSAFGTGGSLVSYYQGSTLLGTKEVGQLTGGYIGFGATSLGGIDNLSIASVPETGSAVLTALAGGALALRRRRK